MERRREGRDRTRSLIEWCARADESGVGPFNCDSEASTMATHGFCSGCGDYVTLGPDGVCPQQHPRSMLRGVRDGAAPEPRAAIAVSSPPDEPHELLANVIGKAFVIVPAVVLFGLVVFFSVAESGAMGLSGPAMWLSGIGSAVLTLGAAVAFGLWRRSKRRTR